LLQIKAHPSLLDAPLVGDFALLALVLRELVQELEDGAQMAVPDVCEERKDYISNQA
jgi:hypothetical protein